MYSFAECALDPARRELRRGGKTASLEPQVFDLLLLLIANRHRVVSKDELLDTIWRGRTVSDSTVTSTIALAREAIGDDGRTQSMIQTLPRRGYRFIENVRESSSDEPPELNSHSPPSISIGVLPLTNIENTASEQRLADAVLADITTDLTRLNGCFVTSWSSSRTAGESRSDVRLIGRELGVRYLLEGGVRRLDEEKIRVDVRLVDTETGARIWADRFEGECINPLALTESVSLQVGRALSVNLVAAASRRTARRHDAGAFDLTLQGRAAMNRRITRENYAEARRLFLAALERAPLTVDALAGLGTANCLDYANFCLVPDEPELLIQAEAALSSALDLEPYHATARYGRALLFTIRRRLDEAAHEARAAISLDRTMTPAYIRLAQIETFLGNPTAAIKMTRDALRISPREPRAGSALYAEAHAHALLGNDTEVVRLSRQAIAAGFKTYFPYTYLASSLAHLGLRDEAHETVAFLRNTFPSVTINRIYANRRSDRHEYLSRWERYLDGLHKSGLPEEG